MEIYIEYVIIDNFLIDLCIIFLMYRLLNEKIRLLLAILSAIFGTAFAIVSPFLIFNNYLLFFIKIIVGIAMVLMARPQRKKFFLALIIFFLITFLFGGMSIGIFYLLGYGFDTVDLLFYNGDLPVGAFIASVIFCFYGIVYIIKKNNDKESY